MVRFIAILVMGLGVNVVRASDSGECHPGIAQECVSPGETAEFQGYAREINEIQTKLAKGQPVARAFHRKAHGCLVGTFSVLADRPDETKVGIFSETRDYPAIARFSNASGRDQSDVEPDMRGFAIKLSGATGTGDQDLLMTNGPVHFAADAKGMMEFAQAGADGPFTEAWWFLTHPKGALVLAHDTLRKVASVTTETYWSRVPILFGEGAAVKFNATPCNPDPNAKRPANPSSTYLSDDLRARAAAGPICFDFRVQFQRDPVKQPIEDASVEWKESDTPSIRVARLTLPAQSFDSTEQLEACENMSFDPWNAATEHRPLGNMNRARRLVYPSSAEFRKAN